MSFLTLIRLFRAFKSAIENRDFEAIVTAASELADVLGFAAEAKELVELIASARAGDYVGVLRNAGEFLVAVAERIATQYGIRLMAATGSAESDFEAALAQMENPAVAVSSGDDSQDAKFNPLPVIIAVFQLIRLIREWRNR